MTVVLRSDSTFRLVLVIRNSTSEHEKEIKSGLLRDSGLGNGIIFLSSSSGIFGPKMIFPNIFDSTKS